MPHVRLTTARSGLSLTQTQPALSPEKFMIGAGPRWPASKWPNPRLSLTQTQLQAGDVFRSGGCVNWRPHVLRRLRASPTNGFTLLEVLLSIIIMAIITTITYMAFSTMTTAWKRGNALSQDLGHGDFVIEQLVMALRSSYYPLVSTLDYRYGFRLEDNGDGPGSGDVISWVKLGQSLIGSDTDLAGVPHRTTFTIESNKKGESCAACKAWNTDDELTDDFSEDTVPYQFLSDHVIGFNCRCTDKELTDDTKWADEWTGEEYTNKLPRALEVTLYMKPLEESDKPLEVRRVIEIPRWEPSWQVKP
jgi:prepilin-type N-terminal cleavage/methylation domain-containing protein